MAVGVMSVKRIVKMNIKMIAASALLALGTMGGAAMAAGCTVGTCSTTGADGQLLSNGVGFNISDIENGVNSAGTTLFRWDAEFVNDLGAPAV